MPFRLFIALFVIVLSLLSSIITAIVAAVILAAVISVLRLDRKSEIRLAILACFAIGLGAVLTPIGEPLSTIVVSKLMYFFYLFNLIGSSIIPFVIIFGILAAFTVKKRTVAKGEVASSLEAGASKQVLSEKEGQKTQSESYGEIVARSAEDLLVRYGLNVPRSRI